MALSLRLVILTFFLPVFVVAGPLDIPAAEIDTELTGGNPRDFFAQRAKDTACTKDLKAKKAEYAKLVAEVKDLKAKRPVTSNANGSEDSAVKAANDEIDRLEPGLNKVRSEFLTLMGKCGECALVKPKGYKVDLGPTKTETWYRGFGVCQIPSSDAAVLAKAYQKITDSLVHAKQYPKKAEGGFANILGFTVARDSDFTALEKVDRFPASPINLFLSVLGPNLGLQFIFHYYLKAEYELKTAPSKQFNMNFYTVEDPRANKSTSIKDEDGKPRTVSDQRLSGRIVPDAMTSNLWLKKVRGQWYMTEDGYLRYFTAAVFGLSVPGVEDKAERILADTLADALARGEWE